MPSGAPACRRARDHRRVEVHRRLHPLRGHVPAGLPRHRPRQRQGVHARRRVLVLRPVRGPLSHRRGHGQHALPAPVKGPELPCANHEPVAASPPPLLLARSTGLRRRRRAAATARRVTVTVGYQSKTINTVTAGTLLRSLGYFEKRAATPSATDGVTYKVDWQDYATGAPITAQMIAGKIDIGSMGDFPLLINAARGKQLRHARPGWSRSPATTCAAASTPSSPRPDSKLQLPRRPARQEGLHERRLGRRRHPRPRPAAGRHRPGQGHREAQPAARRGRFGAAGGQRGRALAVRRLARPARLPGQGEGALRRRRSWTCPPSTASPSARTSPSSGPAVAGGVPARPGRGHRLPERRTRWPPPRRSPKATGLPAEVVYLYNGAHGIATFDPALKPQLVAALKKDVPVLKRRRS